MVAKKQDLHVEQGTTWAQGWLVKYNGTAIDNTWTAKSQVRLTPSDYEMLHEFSTAVGADGAVVISASAAVSSDWSWTEGVYDVEVTNTDGSVILRVAEGAITVSPEVTR